MSTGVTWHPGFLWSCISTCQPRLVSPLGQRNNHWWGSIKWICFYPSKNIPPFSTQALSGHRVKVCFSEMLVSNFVLKMFFVYSGKSVFPWNFLKLYFKTGVYFFCFCRVFVACLFMLQVCSVSVWGVGASACLFSHGKGQDNLEGNLLQ